MALDAQQNEIFCAAWATVKRLKVQNAEFQIKANHDIQIKSKFIKAKGP